MEARARRSGRRARAARAVAGASAAALLLPVTAAGAATAPTDLDPSFRGTGSFGAALVDSEQSAQFRAVDVQDDGSIVAAGYTAAPTALTTTGTVVRFAADGSLDTGFSGDGIATVAEPGARTTIHDVDVLADGSILVAGTNSTNGVGSGDMLVARLNTDGSLDTGFGGDGIVVVAIGSGGVSNDDEAYEVVAEPDGSVVAVGVSTSLATGRDTTAIKLTSSGMLDAGFGGGTGVVTSGVVGDESGLAAALQGDGRIVIAGEGAGGARLARLTAAGSWDANFGTAGVLQFAMGANELFDERLTGVAVLSSGAIVASGYAYVQQPDLSYLSAVVAIRVTPAGLLDATFAGDGIAMTNSSAAQHGSDLAVQADGSLLVAGDAYDDVNSRYQLLIARFDESGGLDTSFDGDGLLGIDGGAGGEASGLALSGGQVVVVGRTGTAPRRALALRLGGDTTAPVPPTVVNDGPGTDVDVADDAWRDSTVANWTASADTGPAGIGSYEYCITVGTAQCGAPSSVWTRAGTGTSLSVARSGALNIASATCVRARDRAGNRSTPTCSDGIVTPNRAPSAPTGVDATLSRRDARYDMRLEWSAAQDADGNLDRYIVQARVGDGARWVTRRRTTGDNAKVTGFDAGDVVRYRVCAVDVLKATGCASGVAEVPWAMSLDGSAGNDELIGERGADDIAGGGGDDVIRGRAGADDLDAGTGADAVFGGAGADTVAGGSGGDLIELGRGDDVVHAERGADRVAGGDGDDVEFGGGGDDYLGGQAGSDVLRGGRGDDHLSAGRGADRLWGGDGSDLVTGGRGHDRLLGGAGMDVLRADDGERDRVDCGPGLDIVYADPQDIVTGCELALVDTLARSAGPAAPRSPAGSASRADLQRAIIGCPLCPSIG